MLRARRHPLWPALGAAFALASSCAQADPLACARLILLDEQELITHAFAPVELSSRPSEPLLPARGRSRSMIVGLSHALFDSQSQEAQAVLSLSLIRLEASGAPASPEPAQTPAGPRHAFSSAIGPSLVGVPVRIRADGRPVLLAHSDRFSLRASVTPHPCGAPPDWSGPEPSEPLRKPPPPPPFL